MPLFESPTRDLKQFCPPPLKLSCHQHQSILRHGVKPNCHFPHITQFCMDSVHCQILFLPAWIVTHYVAKIWCCGFINFWFNNFYKFAIILILFYIYQVVFFLYFSYALFHNNLILKCGISLLYKSLSSVRIG